MAKKAQVGISVVHGHDRGGFAAASVLTLACDMPTTMTMEHVKTDCVSTPLFDGASCNVTTLVLLYRCMDLIR